MQNAFIHLHMPPELACEFWAVFSRLEYALKATMTYAEGSETGVDAAWDKFANAVDAKFRGITDESLLKAVDYLWTNPPRKQVVKQGSLLFVPVPIDANQAKAQQVLLMVRRIRNNLFHGGKHLPDGEKEAGRNEMLVSSALTVLRYVIGLDEDVRIRFEY